LFGGLLEEQIDQILPLMEPETYEAGATIIVEDEPNDKIRFILEGRVTVMKKGITFVEFKEGDSFGEMAVLDVMPASATIKTLAPTRVMSISNRALHDIYKLDIKTFSMMIMNLARDLSRRLRYMDEQIAGGKFKSA
jgi:CRP-like cAMP-binding protein